MELRVTDAKIEALEREMGYFIQKNWSVAEMAFRIDSELGASRAFLRAIMPVLPDLLADHETLTKRVRELEEALDVGAVEDYIAALPWSREVEGLELVEALVAGNIRTFADHVRRARAALAGGGK